MSKIKDEFVVGKYKVLVIDSPLPSNAYRKYRINDKDYEPVPVYDFPCVIAIIAAESTDSLIDKEVEFV